MLFHHHRRNVVACGSVCFLVVVCICYDFYQAEQQLHLPRSEILLGGGGGGGNAAANGVKHAHAHAHAHASNNMIRCDEVKVKADDDVSHGMSIIRTSAGAGVKDGGVLVPSSHTADMSMSRTGADVKHKTSHNMIMSMNSHLLVVM
jgi:hypothetical protein